MLGPLEVNHEGAPQLVSGAKARELLSLLAMRPNEPISQEVLIDELWEGSPPATAASALRVHISHVRSALEPARNGQSARLPLDRAGYVLRVAVEELDASHFELLALQGREAGMHGDVLAAELAFAAALDHWRGPPLAEIRSLGAAQGAIARLEQLRQSALEDLGEVRLALGKHFELIDALLQAVRDFPLAERLTAQLMLALYRSGRQAEALRAYWSLARRLDDELGAQPSAEVRQLEEDILLQRDRIDFVGPAAQRPIAPALNTTKVVGRRAELAQLLDLYELAASGSRRVALVSGAAGIGKTTLAAAGAERAALRGATVLAGACAPDPDSPAPIAQILESALLHVDAKGDAGDAGRDAIDLLRASPSAGHRSPPVVRDYKSEQLRLLEGVLRTITSLEECPVLVVEDVQWADDSTLLVLRQLLRHPDMERLLVIVTYRKEQVDERRQKTIARLAPRANTEAIHLGGLNEHEVRSLVRAAMGPQVVPALLGVAVALRDATDGNPFHLRALLEELEVPAMASMERADLEQLIESLAPLDVSVLVGERLARLSEPSQLVAQAAATIAREISPDLLADVCDLSVDDVLDAIDEATAAGLMVEDERDIAHFEFAHALVRTAIYFGTSDDERHRIHQRVAETMEAHNARVENTHSQNELAKHFNSALPDGDRSKAAFYAERAGRDAAARLAFSESAHWYERAIICSEHLQVAAGDLGWLHLALATAYESMQQAESATAACRRAATYAREAHDARLLVDIALTATETWTTGFETEDWTQELLEEAVAVIAGVDPRRHVRVLGRRAVSLYYAEPEQCARLAEEAANLSRSLRDPTTSAEALVFQHLALTQDPPARRERLAMERKALHLAGGAPSELTMRIRRGLLTDLLENTAIDDFDTELECYERDAGLLSSARDTYWALALRATQATLRGDLSAGEQLARGAAARGFDLDPNVAGTEYLQRFVIRFQQGRLSEMVGPPVEQPDLQTVYRAGAALPALALAETGRIEPALRTARWAVGRDGHGIARDALWLPAHALLAVVAFRADDRDLAALLDELITPCANHLVTFGAGAAVLGSGHHWLGLLAHTQGMPDRAIEHLTTAEAVSEEINAPFWLAQARFDLAMVLEFRDRAGDREHARELRAEAVRAAEAGGFDRILTRATSHPR